MRVPLVRSLIAVSAVLAVFAVPAGSSVAKSSSTTYKGAATNVKGDFKYGKVSATVKSGKLTAIKVESVSSICAGYYLNRTYVYSSKDKTGRIVAGTNKVKKGKVVFNFKADPEVDDTMMFNLKVTSSKVTGSITGIGVCQGAAKISAKK